MIRACGGATVETQTVTILPLLSKAMVDIQQQLVQVDNMFELVDAPPTRKIDGTESLAGRPATLAFENVSFHYGSKVPALKEVSFRLDKEIGQEGANSKTYIAHDEQLDAEIVIKKVPHSGVGSVDQYFEESRILYMSAHPNVVQVYYACKDASHIYIAMPYYRRGSLNALMNARFLTVREIVTLG